MLPCSLLKRCCLHLSTFSPQPPPNFVFLNKINVYPPPTVGDTSLCIPVTLQLHSRQLVFVFHTWKGRTLSSIIFLFVIISHIINVYSLPHVRPYYPESLSHHSCFKTSVHTLPICPKNQFSPEYCVVKSHFHFRWKYWINVLPLYVCFLLIETKGLMALLFILINV